MPEVLKHIRSTSSRINVLFFAHLTNDVYGNVLPSFLPLLMSVYMLSYLLAGALITIYSITSSILQPLIGYLYDRWPKRSMMPIGIALSCIGISLFGLTNSYAVLALLVAISGLGAAAFHPPAFTAVVTSRTARKGGAMGFFVAGGNIGFFIGPLAAGVIASTYGLKGTPLLLPLGLVVAAILLKLVPTTQVERKPAEISGAIDKKGLTLLTTVAGLRALSVLGVIAFLPAYFVSTGKPLLFATSLTSLWLGVGVVG